MEEKEEIVVELNEKYAVIQDFPENALDLTINVEIFQDGHLQKVRSYMDMQEVADAIQETKDGYTPGLWELDFDEVDSYAPVHDCIVLSLPINAVHVSLEAKVYTESGLEVFGKVLDLEEIRRDFQMAEDDYVPRDATFVITEEGKKYAEELLKRHG